MSIAILMGSASDMPAMLPAVETLKELGVPVEVRVISAHRTPAVAADFASGAAARGVKVLICAAGGAAHLAGVIAAHTLLPVLGVPLNRSLGGLDSLYATVQMPAGIPVATVAIDGAQNAALLAAQIIAVADDGLRGKLAARREANMKKVIASDEEITAKHSQP